MQRFGPKSENHHSIGKKCSACNKKFKAGDFTTVIKLGPGENKEEQERARNGLPYNAISTEIHFSCATGIPDPE